MPKGWLKWAWPTSTGLSTNENRIKKAARKIHRGRRMCEQPAVEIMVYRKDLLWFEAPLGDMQLGQVSDTRLSTEMIREVATTCGQRQNEVRRVTTGDCTIEKADMAGVKAVQVLELKEKEKVKAGFDPRGRYEYSSPQTCTDF